MAARRVLINGRSHVLVSVPLRNDPALSQLTPSELAIARALVAGASNQLVSATRQTSVRTVANQVAMVFQKLGVFSRAELIARLAGVDLSAAEAPR